LYLLQLLLLIVYKMLTMSYEGFVTIMLTAIAVMLAILAIIIAILAVFGYAGFKDAVRDAVSKSVGPIMAEKLKEYPDAAKFIELYESMETRLAFLDSVQNKIVSSPASESSPESSNLGAKETEAKKDKVETPIEPYPGEEPHNVSNTTTAAPATGGSAPADTGADHSEPPKDSTS